MAFSASKLFTYLHNEIPEWMRYVLWHRRRIFRFVLKRKDQIVRRFIRVFAAIDWWKPTLYLSKPLSSSGVRYMPFILSKSVVCNLWNEGDFSFAEERSFESGGMFSRRERATQRSFVGRNWSAKCCNKSSVLAALNTGTGLGPHHATFIARVRLAPRPRAYCPSKFSWFWWYFFFINIPC